MQWEYLGGNRRIAPLILHLRIRWVRSPSSPVHFIRVKHPPHCRSHSLVGWVGPRAGLDNLEKRKMSCPFRDSNPVLQVVTPVPPVITCFFFFLFICISRMERRCKILWRHSARWLAGWLEEKNIELKGMWHASCTVGLLPQELNWSTQNIKQESVSWLLSKPGNSQKRFRIAARWDATICSAFPPTGNHCTRGPDKRSPTVLHRSARQQSSGIPTHMLWHSEHPTKAIGHTDCHLHSTILPNVIARYAQTYCTIFSSKWPQWPHVTAVHPVSPCCPWSHANTWNQFWPHHRVTGCLKIRRLLQKHSAYAFVSFLCISRFFSRIPRQYRSRDPQHKTSQEDTNKLICNKLH
jgi:hypothetical protein